MSENGSLTPKIEEIINTIGELSVLDLAELVKALEDKFGVSAAAPVMMAGAAPAGGDAPAAEVEQTEFPMPNKGTAFYFGKGTGRGSASARCTATRAAGLGRSAASAPATRRLTAAVASPQRSSWPTKPCGC